MNNKIIRVLSDEVSIRLGKKMKLSTLNGGSSNVSFKSECENGEKYVIKVQHYIHELDVQQSVRKYLDLCDLNHPKLILAFSSEKIPGIYITVSEWMVGDSLFLKDRIVNISELQKKAQQAAKTVKLLHTIDLSEFKNKRILDNNFGMDTIIQLIASIKINFPYQEQIFRAIKNGIDDICSPKGIVHMDLRPDNMVFTDCSCKLIDMETLSIDHIWADFSYAVEINFPEERFFWILFLQSYFKGNIPDEFWKETRQQILIKLLALMRLNEGTGNQRRQYELAEKIYKDYSEFQSYKPIWMEETITKLEGFTNKSRKV